MSTVDTRLNVPHWWFDRMIAGTEARCPSPTGMRAQPGDRFQVARTRQDQLPDGHAIVRVLDTVPDGEIWDNELLVEVIERW